MSLQASMVLIIIALYYKSAARLTQLANKVKKRHFNNFVTE
jgi:hypothetical protein